MREIKFRGKLKEHFGNKDGSVVIQKGTWIKGGVVFDEDRVWIDTKYHGQILVDKETVGQYTGLHDKNGKEIYEGDIVKIDCPTMKLTGKIKYSEMSAMFYIHDEIEDIEETLWYQKEEYEVIGNIYENPELLKED